MNQTLAELKVSLAGNPRAWLVTGAAGFIGSHLVENLLACGQRVVGVDNFSNGFLENLDDVRASVGPAAWKRFTFIEEDVRFLTLEAGAVDIILHQAALGSVPRSIENPVATHEANVTGTLRMLNLARQLDVKRFVYASSSSVYGDRKVFPQTEDSVGQPLSPYAVSKRAAELYAMTFAQTYGLPAIGLRYFNVFGPRQRPDGPYSAVIPRWIDTLLKGERASIYGDGQTSRDFCYIDNVVKANLLAGTSNAAALSHSIYNITLGGSTSLNELYFQIQERLKGSLGLSTAPPLYLNSRTGDLNRSQADISRAQDFLKYFPEVSVAQGLAKTVQWYSEHRSRTDTSNLSGVI